MLKPARDMMGRPAGFGRRIKEFPVLRRLWDAVRQAVRPFRRSKPTKRLTIIPRSLSFAMRWASAILTRTPWELSLVDIQAGLGAPVVPSESGLFARSLTAPDRRVIVDLPHVEGLAVHRNLVTLTANSAPLASASDGSSGNALFSERGRDKRSECWRATASARSIRPGIPFHLARCCATLTPCRSLWSPVPTRCASRDVSMPPNPTSTGSLLLRSSSSHPPHRGRQRRSPFSRRGGGFQSNESQLLAHDHPRGNRKRFS
jgi:hypothetical protein